MITPMIISFRESLEMLLVIIPLLIYIYKINKKELAKFIYLGSTAGILASVVVGTVLYEQVKSIQGYPQQLFQGGIMLFLSALVLYNIAWIGNYNKSIFMNVEEQYKLGFTSLSFFLLSFLTIFRESMEVIIFVLPTITESPTNIAVGILIGILIALVMAVIIFKTTSKLKANVNILFAILTLVLIIIGGMMFGESLTFIFPSYGVSIEKSASLVYIIPLMFLFVKRELKKIIKK